MAAITWPDVTHHYASMSTVDVTAQGDILALVNRVVNVGKLGGEDHPRVKMARVHYAAHFGELWIRQNDVGNANEDVRSEVVGAQSVSIAYADRTGSDSDEDLSTTPGGRAYRGLVRRSACRVGIVPRGC